MFSFFSYEDGDFNQKSDVFVHQFLSNGQPDPGFGTNGKVVIGATESDDRVFDLAVDSQGNIFLGGYYDAAPGVVSTTPAMVISLNSSGQLRQSFGNGGIALFDVEDVLMNANGISIAANGDVLFVGHQYTPATFSQNGYLARLNSAGQLVQSFGIVPISLTEGEMAEVREASDGTILVAGIFKNGGDFDDDVVLAKFTAGGTLMSSFNATGISAPWDLHYGEEEVTAIALLPSGDVLVGGYGFFDAEPGSGGGMTPEPGNRGGGGGGGFFGEMGYVLRFNNSLSIGVSETSTESKTLVFPNPAGDMVQLVSTIEIRNVDIQSISGQKVLTLEGVNTTSVKMDLGSLANGVYTIRMLYSDGSLETQRLEIQ